MLDADHPRQVASNAFLKLCRLDATAETEKWARTGKFLGIPADILTLTSSATILGRWSSGCHHSAQRVPE
jgi:hypothetical protein